MLFPNVLNIETVLNQLQSLMILQLFRGGRVQTG